VGDRESRPAAREQRLCSVFAERIMQHVLVLSPVEQMITSHVQHVC
jgi:hypothetical protein